MDLNTERKVGLQFSRILVEVELEAKLPDTVLFRNEKGQFIEQRVNYTGSQLFALIASPMSMKKRCAGRQKSQLVN